MIHICKSRNGQFYFTVHAKNGKKLCHSETYKQKRSVIKALKAVYQQIIRSTDKDFNFYVGKLIDHTIKIKRRPER
jgi:uncharacterized protein YegP (UPF0339 family)